MKASLYSYTLPLSVALELRGRRIVQRSGLLLRLVSAEGHEGWGEAAPLPGFSRESIAEVEAQLLAWSHAVSGLEASAYETLSHASPSARWAVAMAEAQLQAARHHLLPHQFLNPAAQAQVSLAFLITASGTDALQAADQAVRQGYRSIKLKVGRRPHAEEAELICEISARMPRGTSLRLDANRAWDLTAAQNFCNAIAECPVEFLEEPLIKPEELPRLLERVQVPIALDETLAESAAAFPHLREDQRALLSRASVLIWKPMLTGLSFHQIRQLQQQFLPVPAIVVSAAFESGLALLHYASCAAALGGGCAAGLDTYKWLAEDVLEPRLPLPAPVLSLNTAARVADRWRKIHG